MARKLSETLEMYLKTILILEREYNPVRMSQIAKARGVSAASVTEAVKTLQDKGLILHKAHQGVRLSAEGRRAAETIRERYDVLYRFLTGVLGLEATAADRDACEIEHVVSKETLERLAAFLDHANRGGGMAPEEIRRFQAEFKSK
jgi:DtxR family Mn-dependent transcriptional regulator